MKKIFLLVISLALTGQMFGQPVTGTKTIPGDYSSVASAISALNVNGTGPGGVTFNIAAGYTETFSYPGDGYITSNSGSASNQIIFLKSGTGNNPKITAAAGAGDMDAVICFSGVKYITFNGIDIAENPLNTTPATRMEWGFAILKASQNQGSQNITIKNCNISLCQSYSETYGIYSANHTTESFSNLYITNISGQNSGNKFYGNTFTGCYNGIFLAGGLGPLLSDGYDQNNDIGSVAGNTFVNFGGGSSRVNGIYTANQNNLIIANSSITGGNGTTGEIYGIYTAPSDNANMSIYGNTITLYSSSSVSSMYGISNDWPSASGTSNTLNFYNNTVQNCVFTTATSADFYGIECDTRAFTTNFYGNTITGNIISGSGKTLFASVLSGTGGTLNVYNNSITNNHRTETGVPTATSYLYCFSPEGDYLTASIHDNTISNNSIVIASNSSFGGTGYGLYLYATNPASVQNIYNNSIHDLTVTSGYTGPCGLNGLLICQVTPTATGSVNHNDIYNMNINLTTSGHGWVTGINSIHLTDFSDNSIHDLNVTCSGSGYGAGDGILIFGGTPPVNICRNKINGVLAEGTGGYVRGIDISGGTELSIYNNFISGLEATESTVGCEAISGIFPQNITTSVHLYYNTVFLNAISTSTGSFHTTGICCNNIPLLDLKNNIVVNTSSAPASTIFQSVALQRNSSDLNTYLLSSNNNCFYAGTPSPNHVIYFDGINTDQTIDAFKARVAPRESQSFSENPPFVNVATPPFDLHINGNLPTQCESGGITITTPSITTDIDNQPRFPNPGYPTPGTAPDVGADEFGICAPPASAGTLTGPATVCQSGTGYVYSVDPIANATGYQWTLPPGAGIISGSGTNSITVNFSSSAVSGNISVAGTSTCGNGSPSTMGITVVTYTTPQISGADTVCINSGYYIYTTEPGFSNYFWNIQGGTISYGQGTDSVWVEWTTAGPQWISIIYSTSSGCVPPSPTVFNVNVTPLPEPAGPVSGIQLLCGGSTGVSYFTQPVTGVTYYVWTLPAGANIVSGSGTPEITVDFAPDASSGNIIVYGNNICGNGMPSSLPVTVNPLPPVPVITPYPGCSFISSASTGNQWYFSPDNSGTGSAIPGATDQIFYPYSSGTGCGYYWTIVTLNDCSSDTSNHFYVCITETDDNTGNEITVYPVPNDGHFNLVTPALRTPFDIVIVNSSGTTIMKKTIDDLKKEHIIDIRPSPSGIYSILLNTGNEMIVKRIVVR